MYGTDLMDQHAGGWPVYPAAADNPCKKTKARRARLRKNFRHRLGRSGPKHEIPLRANMARLLMLFLHLSMPVGLNKMPWKRFKWPKATGPQWPGPMVPCRAASASIEARASPLGQIRPFGFGRAARQLHLRQQTFATTINSLDSGQVRTLRPLQEARQLV
jgi:hypothetical protein